jgi:hypothetical protein
LSTFGGSVADSKKWRPATPAAILFPRWRFVSPCVF